MNAGHVLGKLINPLLRFVLMHQAGVAVAPDAELRNLSAGNLPEKPSRSAHSGFRGLSLGVSPVTTGTSQADMLVDVIGERGRGRLVLAIQGGMTFLAGVLSK